jgi:hypothetical protein
MIYISLIVIGIVFLLIINQKNNRKTEENEKRFKAILVDKNLNPDQIIFSITDNSRNCISVNEANRKVSFGFVEEDVFQTIEHDFTDFIGFEVQVNDQKTGDLSIGGALVGGLLAGGAGAIIGGTTGKSKTTIKTMNLLITVNSISNPIVKFPIIRPINSGKGYDSESFVIKNAIKTAEKWTGIFAVILNKH